MCVCVCVCLYCYACVDLEIPPFFEDISPGRQKEKCVCVCVCFHQSTFTLSSTKSKRSILSCVCVYNPVLQSVSVSLRVRTVFSLKRVSAQSEATCLCVYVCVCVCVCLCLCVCVFVCVGKIWALKRLSTHTECRLFSSWSDLRPRRKLVTTHTLSHSLTHTCRLMCRQPLSPVIWSDWFLWYSGGVQVLLGNRRRVESGADFRFYLSLRSLTSLIITELLMDSVH